MRQKFALIVILGVSYSLVLFQVKIKSSSIYDTPEKSAKTWSE